MALWRHNYSWICLDSHLLELLGSAGVHVMIVDPSRHPTMVENDRIKFFKRHETFNLEEYDLSNAPMVSQLMTSCGKLDPLVEVVEFRCLCMLCKSF
jgi:hypothetical protein